MYCLLHKNKIKYLTCIYNFQQQIVNKNLEHAKLESLMNDVKDLLPHLGVGFIQVS